MGGNLWTYFVPYQSDVKGAFEALRQQVFDTGEYVVMPPPAAGLTFKQFCVYYNDIQPDQLSDEERAEEEARYKEWSTPCNPKTIDELLEWNGSEGTGTILDVTTFDKMYQLRDNELREMYGTVFPNRKHVDTLSVSMSGQYGRDCGVYLIVYDNGQPSELCFAGLTGD